MNPFIEGAIVGAVCAVIGIIFSLSLPVTLLLTAVLSTSYRVLKNK